MRKQEPIPPGWGVDNNGQETLDGDLVYNEGGLTPLGGSELTCKENILFLSSSSFFLFP